MAMLILDGLDSAELQNMNLDQICPKSFSSFLDQRVSQGTDFQGVSRST